MARDQDDVSLQQHKMLAKSANGETWQLLFIMDRSSYEDEEMLMAASASLEKQRWPRTIIFKQPSLVKQSQTMRIKKYSWPIFRQEIGRGSGNGLNLLGILGVE